MAPELRLPIMLWIATSALLLLWAARSEGVIYLALAYVALNGGSLAAGVWRNPPLHPKALQTLAWCTSAQLPTMLVVVFDSNGSGRLHRRKVDRDAREGAEGQTGLWPEGDDSSEPGTPV